MIQYIEGELLSADLNEATILAHGVGYKIFATAETIENLKESAKNGLVSVYTHLAVRENSMDLYGFKDTKEMKVFELLLSVSGIGPKSALSILNIAPIETLKEAVTSNDSSYLTKVSGIGTKSAQKIVLELQGKMGVISESSSSVRKADLDIYEALKALGYSTGEIRSAVKEISPDIKDTGARIKEALRLMGK